MAPRHRASGPPLTSTLVVRRLIQLSVVALVAYLSLKHQIGGREAAGPIDSYCPFGAIESLPALIEGSGFIRRIGTSNLVLFGSLAVVTLTAGGGFCGWLCPFGTVQDWLASAGRLIFGRQLKVPMPVHRYLKHMRWAVLLLIVWMSWRTAGLWFARYDPYRALFDFGFESSLAIGLIAVTILGGIAVERFWCIYACPLGALVGVGAVLSPTKVRRVTDSCTDCGFCSTRCPMRIPVDEVETVADQHCTMCTECVEVCPQPETLKISTGAAHESFRPLFVGIVTTVLFFALIGTGWAMGWWQTGQGCAGCSTQIESNIQLAEAPGYSMPRTLR